MSHLCLDPTKAYGDLACKFHKSFPLGLGDSFLPVLLVAAVVLFTVAAVITLRTRNTRETREAMLVLGLVIYGHAFGVYILTWLS